MKVFILSNANSIHTKRWVSSLSHSMKIFLFSPRPCKDNFYSKLHNVQVYSFLPRFDKKFIDNLRYFNCVNVLKKKIKEFNPDILHAHYASSYGLLGALTGFHPYIISVWGSDVYKFPRKSHLHKVILEYSFSKADKILSTSHIMSLETSKYTKKQLEITPFGVDTKVFYNSHQQKDRSKFIIGNVKTLSPKYGIDILIRAYALVCKKNPSLDTELVIIGEGPNRIEYENLSKKLLLSDKIKFLGEIENYNLPQYYNSFSVFASISNSESFGVVAVEAMACECPVITSDADGFTEVVIDSETGFIVPKQDVQATAAAIQKFIDTPGLREKMGSSGRKHVMKLYSWEENVKTMIDIYSKFEKKNNK